MMDIRQVSCNEADVSALKDASVVAEVNVADDDYSAKFKTPPMTPVSGIVQPPVRPPADKPTRSTNQLEHIKNFVLSKVQGHRYAWPFLKPVDTRKLHIPDYFKVVKRPMDFGTVERRIKNQYYYSAREALHDIETIFANCFLYNNPDDDVCLMAAEVKAVVDAQLKSMPLNEVEIVRQRGGRQKCSNPDANMKKKANSGKGSLRTPKKSISESFCLPSPGRKQLELPDPQSASASMSENSPSAMKTTALITTQADFHYSPPKWKSMVPRLMNRPSEELRAARAVIGELLSPSCESFAHPFYQPVDAKALNLPDYHTIITSPMDLETINLNQYVSPEEIFADLDLIVHNAFTYNTQDNAVRAAATALRTFIASKRNILLKPKTKTTIGPSTTPVASTAAPNNKLDALVQSSAIDVNSEKAITTTTMVAKSEANLPKVTVRSDIDSTSGAKTGVVPVSDKKNEPVTTFLLTAESLGRFIELLHLEQQRIISTLANYNEAISNLSAMKNDGRSKKKLPLSLLGMACKAPGFSEFMQGLEQEKIQAKKQHRLHRRSKKPKVNNLSYEKKLYISTKIAELPVSYKSEVVRIIEKTQPTSISQTQDSLDIDFDTLLPDTLKLLYALVKRAQAASTLPNMSESSSSESESDSVESRAAGLFLLNSLSFAGNARKRHKTTDPVPSKLSCLNQPERPRVAESSQQQFTKNLKSDSNIRAPKATTASLNEIKNTAPKSAKPSSSSSENVADKKFMKTKAKNDSKLPESTKTPQPHLVSQSNGKHDSGSILDIFLPPINAVSSDAAKKQQCMNKESIADNANQTVPEKTKERFELEEKHRAESERPLLIQQAQPLLPRSESIGLIDELRAFEREKRRNMAPIFNLSADREIMDKFEKSIGL